MSTCTGLYIHIPFCPSKCDYCSFVSYAGREYEIDTYLDALQREMMLHAGQIEPDSVYVGGGTPSLLSARQTGKLFRSIRQNFNLPPTAEITLEANPGTIDSSYLAGIRGLGANRLSVGVQSLNDTELRMLGRSHNSAEARRAVQFARSAGFQNINLDLIFGLPGQDLAGWKHSLEEALALRPEHLSLYGLALGEESRLRCKIESGQLPVPDPDMAAEQYELAEKTLKRTGYHHYEISNWALPGFECRHNLNCWNGASYLGIGAAACSYLYRNRWTNTNNLEEYMASLFDGQSSPRREDEFIGDELLRSEAVILGLRLTEGIELKDYRSRYGIDLLSAFAGAIAELEECGLLVCNRSRLFLTPRGRLLGNEVFWHFLPDARINVC